MMASSSLGKSIDMALNSRGKTARLGKVSVRLLLLRDRDPQEGGVVCLPWCDVFAQAAERDLTHGYSCQNDKFQV
jgi:hypothetical protein